MTEHDNQEDRTESFVILTSGVRILQYEIIKKIDSGAMGEVYLALDTKLNRQVAIKFLSHHLCQDEECRARFQREAQAAARLGHANIVAIHEVGEHIGRPFFVMEMVKGDSLAKVIAGRNMSEDEIIEVATGICNGLRKAHEAGIIHRDIKPSNILLDTDGVPRLLDFGLAAVLDSNELTQSGSVLGTVGYMSPEQVEGRKIDIRSDLFSLGVLLYELVAGFNPFKRDSQTATLKAILEHQPESIRTYRIEISAELEHIIAKLLEKSPADRPHTVAEVIAELQAMGKRLNKDSAPVDDIPSIAVLPFANLSADAEQEYFCDGVTEEITNKLAQLSGLQVVARTSSFVFKNTSEDVRLIGKKLRVTSLLEGSVRLSGKRIRVAAQLVDTSRGFHLWSEQFDREVGDVFALQDEISVAVAERLKISLLGKEREKMQKRPTEDPEAHRLYLKGRYFWRKRAQSDMNRALEYFEKATAKDPNYALAHSGMADTYTVMLGARYTHTDEAKAWAKEAALKALQLDDSLAEAHTSYANVLWFIEKDYDGAESEFRRALLLSPGYATAHQWYSAFLNERNCLEEALYEGERALELDPLSVATIGNIISIKLRLWQWGDVRGLFEQCLEIEPRNETMLTWYGEFLMGIGETTEGEAEIRKALKIAPHSVHPNIALGRTLYRIGRFRDAVLQTQRAIELVPQSQSARIFKGMALFELGEEEEATAALAEARKLSRDSITDELFIDLLLVPHLHRKGETYLVQRTLDQATAMVEKEEFSPYWLAAACIGAGRREDGLKFLNVAFNRNDSSLAHVMMEPAFNSIRDDPRFQDLLAKIGLIGGSTDNP